MHRVNIHLTVLLSALVLAGRADAHNGDHTAYAIPISGITIDGRLDDWPERMAVYPIAWVSPTYYKSEPPEGPHDLTASFRVGYDPSENVLYVAVLTRDDDWVIDPEDGSFDNQDLSEIYIDADHSGQTGDLFARARDAQQYVLVAGPSRFSYTADGNPALNGGDTARSGLRAAYLRLGEYTVYEWAIPLWSYFPEQRYSIEPGATIGFDAVVADADGDEEGNWVAWTSESNKVFDADLLGNLNFVADYDGLDLEIETVLSPTLQTAYDQMACITGRVLRGSSGETWPDANVQLLTAAGEPVAGARADSTGRYRIWTTAGTYQISASPYAEGEPVTVAVDAGERRENVDLTPELARISGRVTHPDGETPWAGVSVSISSTTASALEQMVSTDTAGAYQCLLPPGAYEITVQDGKGADPRQIELQNGDDIKDIDFAPEAIGQTWPMWPMVLVIGLAGVAALLALVPLYQRRVELGGVLLAPAQTFQHLAAQPDWKGPLLMVLISGLVGAIGTAMLLFSQLSPDAAVPMFQAIVVLVGLVLVFPGVVLMVGFVWTAETALLWILTRVAGQSPSYMAVLCSTGYANMPSALIGSVVAAVAILAGYDLSQGSPLSLGGLWPDLAAGNAVLAAVLQLIDLFTLWSLVLTVPALQAICALTPGRAKLVVAAQAAIVLGIMAGFTALAEAVSQLMSSL
ncbi:carboxypeptidase regulatory-like domain-containing protein [bacterium]|nr:carboxypeptidase regulatory-like domain-containing protein [bacterium]